MNNNRGQTLVMFVLLLPVILFIAAYIIDSGLLFYEKTKLDNISKTACNYIVKENFTVKEKKIKELIKNNDKSIENIYLETSNKEVIITVSKKVDSLFGTVFGTDRYQIKSKKKCME